MAGWMAGDVKKSIFDKVSNELDTVWKEIGKAGQTQNGVGNSFEQIILNQAKAMQPARTSGDGSATPTNLPTEEKQNKEKPKVVHNYAKDDDPYREPLG